MTLWTLDEARAAVVASAAAILSQAQCDLGTRAYLVWGAGGIQELSAVDEVLSRRHREVLDAVIDQGYAWAAVEELEGLCSAAGIDDAKGDAISLLSAPRRRGHGTATERCRGLLLAPTLHHLRVHPGADHEGRR